MANNNVICSEADGTISFGDYTLSTKTKVSDFLHDGNLYKVKTFREITKLEKNGLFVYESVPGTKVSNFKVSENEVSFGVLANEDVQITLELDTEKVYRIDVNGNDIGGMKTNLGGKLVISLEINKDEVSTVRIVK